ncbi:MAG: YcjX family protein, partial [Thiovulaceae bacterium]|nr:YcjX family protein [Sulfurimonadaceae bacterium]
MKKNIFDTIANIPKEIGEKISGLSATGSIKIAVTGLSRSGKTVFLTSLIDQLLYEKRLIGVTSSKQPFKVTIKPPLHNVRRFDYYTLIEQLKNGHIWPKGTDSISHTLLEFESKSRFAFLGNSTFTLELIDYPGEWLLDLTLLKLNYEQWSEQVLVWLKEIDEPEADRYLQQVASLDEKSDIAAYESALYRDYKELVVHLKQHHYSQITPGRFVMPGDLANDPILNFAPVTTATPALVKVFKERYNRYVKEVVKDIQLEHFKGFERQVVLVDVIEALQNGYKCHRDMKAGLKKMLDIYDHKNKNFMAQWFSPSIKKVLFVATKADQIAASQHANFSLLLEAMIEEIRREMDISHIGVESQIVSALKSTLTIEKKHEGMMLSFVRG